MTYTFEQGIERILEIFNNDYAEWTDRANIKLLKTNEYSLEEGRNYFKIVIDKHGNQQTVAGFIVKKDTKKFKKGDLLKAASWSAPATNFARGNVFEEDSMQKCIHWTGIM